MTEYMVSSAAVGRRPRIVRMRRYSSCFSPSSLYGCRRLGSACATSTVSTVTAGPPPPSGLRSHSAIRPARRRKAGRRGPSRSVGPPRARAAAEVAHHNPSGRLQFVEGALVSDVAALAVLDRDDDFRAGPVAPCPHRDNVLDNEPLVSADEPSVVVAYQRTGQQMRFA